MAGIKVINDALTRLEERVFEARMLARTMEAAAERSNGSTDVPAWLYVWTRQVDALFEDAESVCVSVRSRAFPVLRDLEAMEKRP